MAKCEYCGQSLSSQVGIVEQHLQTITFGLCVIFGVLIGIILLPILIPAWIVGVMVVRWLESR